jgi:ribosomal protein S18 acetylase RimI-like enzyme
MCADDKSTQTMEYLIRPAMPHDLDAMCALLPRLAEFELPHGRVPRHLWRGDEKVLKAWAAGNDHSCLVHVAEGKEKKLLGVAMARLRAEMLSGEPSAHLEVLMVAREAEGNGIGKALVAASEFTARVHGAKTMTLHTFRTNTRARQMYEELGYDGEIIRYSKNLKE